MRTSRLVLPLILLLPAACQDASNRLPLGDQPAASIVAESLPPVAQPSGVIEVVDVDLVSLVDVVPLLEVNAESCALIQNRLFDACQRIDEHGLAPYGCAAEATFFFANDTPRCGGRVTLWQSESDRFPQIVAFDVSGPPIVGYGARCGNGTLDEGEACDDGNHDEWDGCDPNCQIEQFQGCETVIEHYFAITEIADVPADAWRAPRTHLMVHEAAQPLRPVDASLCGAAGATAQDVCNELIGTMPFVSWCEPSTQWDASLGACSVRLNVFFGMVSPDDAVFTTRLGGVLELTLR